MSNVKVAAGGGALAVLTGALAYWGLHNSPPPNPQPQLLPAMTIVASPVVVPVVALAPAPAPAPALKPAALRISESAPVAPAVPDCQATPLDECDDVFFDFDRSVNVADKVVIYRRSDGKIERVEKIESFDSIPKYAQQVCERNCWFAATITEQSIDGWLVSSYGRKFVVQFDANSMLLDHEGVNIIYVDFHGQRYEAEIDPKAVNQTAVIYMPCWKDRLTAPLAAFCGTKITTTVGATK